MAARHVKAPEGEGPRLRIAGEPLTEEPYGIVLRKGEPVLLERINVGLRVVRESGQEQALVERWLR
jgi:ABC-type amino acid transport substrate-binding protein